MLFLMSAATAVLSVLGVVFLALAQQPIWALALGVLNLTALATYLQTARAWPRRNPLQMAPVLMIGAFLCNQSFIGLSCGLACATGYWGIAPFVYAACFVPVIVTLLQAARWTISRETFQERMGVILVLFVLPCWFLGGSAAVGPFASQLTPWFLTMQN